MKISLMYMEIYTKGQNNDKIFTMEEFLSYE